MFLRLCLNLPKYLCIAGLVLMLLLVIFCPLLIHAQKDNTFYVKSFAGPSARTVGEMTKKAQSACDPNTSIPCVLVFDPTLAVYTVGTMPDKCERCIWLDYRQASAPLAGGVSGNARVAGGRVLLDSYYSVDWGTTERIAADVAQHVVTIWPNLVNTTQFYQDKTDSLVPLLLHAGSRPYNNSTTSQAVFCCDSLTEGWTGSTVYDWVNLVTVYDWARVNVAIGGSTASQWLLSADVASGQPNAYTRIDNHLAPFAKNNVAVIWACTNDFYNHYSTGAQCLATVQALAQDRRRQGWKVVVATLQSMSDPTAETAREEFNTLIRAQWHQFADGLVDLAAVAAVGAHGASANTTYFPDNKHLSAAGYDLVRPLFQSALLTIANNTQGLVLTELRGIVPSLPVKGTSLTLDDNQCVQWTNNTVKVCGTQAGNAVQVYTNNILQLQMSWDGALFLYQYKATTGTRYLCTDTTGKLVASASACSGT